MVMKRMIDITCAFLGLLILGLPILAVSVLIKLTSKGPAFYWSDRVGRDNRIFRMPKFRTMREDAPVVATHLLGDPERYLTSLGTILRKYSIDELPQLFSILKGDMSFVGPRPALFNQDDLITLRTEKGIHLLTPGLTGWAQVNGRDELPIPVKVSFDEYYLKHQSLVLDVRIIIRTVVKIASCDGIAH